MDEFINKLRDLINSALLDNNSPKQIKDAIYTELSSLKVIEDIDNLGQQEYVLEYLESREKGQDVAKQKQQTKPKAEVLP